MDIATIILNLQIVIQTFLLMKILFATTRLNTFGRSCAFGLISAFLSKMCLVSGKIIINNNYYRKRFWNW